VDEATLRQARADQVEWDGYQARAHADFPAFYGTLKADGLLDRYQHLARQKKARERLCALDECRIVPTVPGSEVPS